MTRCRKPVLTLVAIAPLLTEIVSGNAPPHAFLNLRIAVFLLLAYGPPVLLIRELSVRWRLPAAGIFILGLAYGILNEGLIAQTLLRSEHVPIDRFDHYIVHAGFNLSWAALIVPWHALLAVVFPIVLVSRWFPACARIHWLGPRLFRGLLISVTALVAFLALVRKPHLQMAACFLAMAVLVSIARWFGPRRDNPAIRSSRRGLAFLWGAASYLLLFLGLIFLAALRVGAWIYFPAAGLIFLLWHAFARDVLPSPAGAPLALGAYCAASLFTLSAGLQRHSLETAVTGALLAMIFAALPWLSPGANSQEQLHVAAE